MSEANPEFQAPPFSVMERRIEGTDVVTMVVVDGQVAEFVASLAVVKAAKKLITREEQ